MATNEENISLIAQIESEIIDNEKISKEECKEQIVLLETAKERFQEPAAILDKALYKQVTEVNDKRELVSAAYQARIDSGCKSDLFWRVVGFSTYQVGGLPPTYSLYNLRCEKISKYFERVEDNLIDPNINSTSVTRADSWTGTAVTSTAYTLSRVDDKLKLSNSFAGVGELDDRDGLKLYTEPYTKDLIDTLVAESYGIISLGSDKLTLLSPFTDDISDIAVDNIVSCEPNPFGAEQSATVLSVGSTSIDLGQYDPAITGGISTTTTVPYITLDTASTLDFSEIPLNDGTYPSFQFSISPDEIDKKEFAVDFEESPYVPQTIKMLEFDSLNKANKQIDGNGIKIVRTNEGYDTKIAKWNAQLEGFPNPEDLDNTVEEPLVSAGQELYILGFDEKPLRQNGNDAQEGDTYDIDTGDSQTFPSSGLYESLPSCSSAVDDAITDAISAKNAASNAWNDVNNNVESRLDLSNALKAEINFINLRIWSLRVQLGDSDSIIKSKQDFNEKIISSGLLELLNNPDLL